MCFVCSYSNTPYPWFIPTERVKDLGFDTSHKIVDEYNVDINKHRFLCTHCGQCSCNDVEALKADCQNLWPNIAYHEHILKGL